MGCLGNEVEWIHYKVDVLSVNVSNCDLNAKCDFMWYYDYAICVNQVCKLYNA